MLIKLAEMKCIKLVRKTAFYSSCFIEAFVEGVCNRCQCCVPETHSFLYYRLVQYTS